jgi:hypothetical protein
MFIIGISKRFSYINNHTNKDIKIIEYSALPPPWVYFFIYLDSAASII